VADGTEFRQEWCGVHSNLVDKNFIFLDAANFVSLHLIGFGIEEEASEVLRLEHSFIWC
jgi:hypothetical protein